MKRIFNVPKKKKTAKREEIEAQAFAQMRKAKAAIDPGILAKVRAAIEKSPMAAQLMGNIPAQQAQKGEKKEEAAPKADAPKEVVVEKAPEGIEEKVAVQPEASPAPQQKASKADKERALKAARAAHANVKEHEKVDQGKMLDIVAKMLEMNPHKNDLKDGIKDILKRKK